MLRNISSSFLVPGIAFTALVLGAPRDARADPFTVTVDITSITLNKGPGTLTVTGTVTCNAATPFPGNLQVQATQPLGRKKALTATTGDSILCNPTSPVSWTETLVPQGRFGTGFVTVQATYAANSDNNFDSDTDTETERL